MNRRQIQLGFILIVLALLTGLAVPFAASPRLTLAAHNVGIIGGLVLIALGALADSFALGPRASKVMMWSWVYAAYANWLGSLLGGLTGASRLTPIAGAGTTGTSVAEAVVAFLLQSLAVAALVGSSIAVWGFRQRRRGAEGSACVRRRVDRGHLRRRSQPACGRTARAAQLTAAASVSPLSPASPRRSRGARRGAPRGRRR